MTTSGYDRIMQSIATMNANLTASNARIEAELIAIRKEMRERFASISKSDGVDQEK